MKILEIKNITKKYGDKTVLNDLSFDIENGEFVTFLGPSGCGKTTMLRIIAGLENPDAGEIYLNGTNITSLPPEKRALNTVFQNYALFPHMNVEKNIEYALKLKKVNQAARKKAVSEMLELVRLSGYEKRTVNSLSGGEKQRVAIARAAIAKPSVLLLDEPLGALDLKLRQYLQTELKTLQKALGMTFIYITHDQEEAMNMSDRIVIMQNGRLEQSGTPAEIYDSPKTAFTASFVGSANIFKSTVTDISNGLAQFEISGERLMFSALKNIVKGRCTLAVRSENIEILTEKAPNSVMATVCDKAYVNGLFRTTVILGDGNKVVATSYSPNRHIALNQAVFVKFDEKKIIYIAEEPNEK